MKQVKAAASLSSSLLLLKGRTNPTALVDQILGEVNAARAAGAPAELQRAEVPQLTRTRERAEANVVMPWRGPVAEPRRPVLENVSRKKLSLRLDRVRHFRLKLVAFHLGISAQEFLTRALESYIEQVAPEMARTRPIPADEIKAVTGPVSDQHGDALMATARDLRPSSESE
jgi:predicted HicB family RNase H-like nuclease